GLRLRLGSRRHVPRRAGDRIPRPARAPSRQPDLDQPGCAVRSHSRVENGGGNRRHGRKDPSVERPLRLVTANPLDQLARTIEALLVVASAPLPLEELTAAADDDPERVQLALGLLTERYQEGRSGIVLESVAGGWAFRASRDASEACGRLFERP